MAVKYGNLGIVTNNLQFYINQDTNKSFRGEATTNMVSAGYESFETAVASYNTSAQFTASRSTDISYFGDYSLFCTRGNSSTDAYADMEGYIAVLANTTYTLSTYVYLTEITSSFNLLRPTFFNNTSYINETTVGISADNTMTSGDLNKWKRKYITFTTPALCNNVLARYNLEGNSSFYPASFYADGRQLEQKSYMTPFISGTRTNFIAGSGGLVDISANKNNANLTGAALFFNNTGFYTTGSTLTSVSAVTISPVKEEFNQASNGSRTYEMWYRLLGNNNNTASYLFGRTGDRFEGFIQGSAPSFSSTLTYLLYYSNLVPAGLTFAGDFNKWYHAACTVDLNSSGAKLYINSEVKDTETLVSGLAPTSGNYFLLGQTGSLISNAIVDQVRVYNTVLNDQQIRQNFDATKSAYGYV